MTTTTEEKIAERKQKKADLEKQMWEAEEELKKAEEQKKYEENEKSRKEKARIERATDHDLTTLNDGEMAWRIDENTVVKVEPGKRKMTERKTAGRTTTESEYYRKTREDELEDQKEDARRNQNRIWENRKDAVVSGEETCSLDERTNSVSTRRDKDEIEEEAESNHEMMKTNMEDMPGLEDAMEEDGFRVREDRETLD